MKISISAIGGRPRISAVETLVAAYRERIVAFVEIDTPTHPSSEAFLKTLDRQKSRMATMLVLLDPRGKQLSSEDLAGWIGKKRDEGQQHLVFAIGPADGWTDAERERANLLLSLGPMTLPHELARVVLSEQIYRAFTILSGHPYHTGH